MKLQIKIVFSSIKDLPMWFFENKENFFSQNSYGHTLVWSLLSTYFFVFMRVDWKLIEIAYKSDSK